MLSAEEFGNGLLVIFIGDIELFLGPVLELRMVDHLVGDTLASEEEDSHHLKIGLLTKDSDLGEAVVSEFVIHSLEETVHEVGELIEDLAFTIVLLVVAEVDRVSIDVVGLPESVHTISGLLVTEVDEEGLEVR